MRFFLLLCAAAVTGCQSPTAPPESRSTPPESTATASPTPAAPHRTEPAAQRPAAVPAAALIVPGRSIGGTALGEPYEAVEARLGTPDASDAAMGKMMATWYAGHNPGGHQTALFFTRNMGAADETSRVRQVRVTSPYFKTAGGLGVGAPLQAIEQQYALEPVAAYEENGTRYRTMGADGILFEIGPGDRCVGIIVARKGDGPPYLSFHPDARVLN